MRLKWLAMIFPLTVLGLMAVERLATFQLGGYPSSALLWALSIELRSIFRDSANWLELGSGHSVALQLGFLAAVCGGLLATMRVRRWAALAFLVNHAAFAFVALAVLVANGRTIASSGTPFVDSGYWLLSGSMRLDAFHYAVLGLGLMGCAACHYLFLAQKRAGHAAVVAALRELAFNLEDRRAVR